MHNHSTTYVAGRGTPLVVRAVGTPRDTVVEFVFGQPAIYDALAIDPKSRQKPLYLVWNRSIRGWSHYPKPHQPLFLVPGERVLYKEAYVSSLPQLEYYQSQLLPADRERADTRYASLASLPERRQDSPGPPPLAPSLPGAPPRISSPQIHGLIETPVPEAPSNSSFPFTPKRPRCDPSRIIDLTSDEEAAHSSSASPTPIASPLVETPASMTPSGCGGLPQRQHKRAVSGSGSDLPSVSKRARSGPSHVIDLTVDDSDDELAEPDGGRSTRAAMRRSNWANLDPKDVIVISDSDA
ncbi:hypothetical protein C8Q73DRAFT_795898 [Cubamyces lactineus]|nr:hypothetical protein C8Q73DRAFT_795898 [Cubamyces lactineus]